MPLYKIVKSFHFGQIVKDMRKGETVEFDGQKVIYQEKTYEAPLLRGALRAGWIIPVDKEVKEEKKEVMQIEASRPLGVRSKKEEKPEHIEEIATSENVTAENWPTEIHWTKRDKLLKGIEDIALLKEILKIEKVDFKKHVEARIKELKKEKLLKDKELEGLVEKMEGEEKKIETESTNSGRGGKKPDLPKAGCEEVTSYEQLGVTPPEPRKGKMGRMVEEYVPRKETPKPKKEERPKLERVTVEQAPNSIVQPEGYAESIRPVKKVEK